MTEEWKSISEASRLYGVSHHVIKRFIEEGRLSSKRALIDKRKILVNVDQLRRILEGSHEEGSRDE